MNRDAVIKLNVASCRGSPAPETAIPSPIDSRIAISATVSRLYYISDDAAPLSQYNRVSTRRTR